MPSPLMLLLIAAIGLGTGVVLLLEGHHDAGVYVIAGANTALLLNSVRQASS